MSDGEEQVAEPTTWVRHLRAAVVERFGLKVIALVIAVLLWLVIRLMYVIPHERAHGLSSRATEHSERTDWLRSSAMTSNS